MRTQETLTQEQMEEQITNFLIRSFILSGDISDVQPSYIKKKLKIDISESDLSYKKMMVYETLIKTEIEAQLDYDNSTPKGEKDEAKAFEKVYKKLAKFDFDKYAKDGGNYFFQWKDGVNDITIKSKKEWEEFKKTDKYKEFKKHQEERKREIKKELERVKKERINESELRREMAKARAEIRKINREEIKNELAKARKEMHKARKEMRKVRMNYSYSSDSDNLMINGKKVKITKKIIIKVPKSATFDLNTRHCKVKLPKTKASGKVSYGTFKADALDGGKLNISYSPVNISSLNACTLFLNNVTDAQLASVTNTIVNSNSSGLVVSNVHNNVEVNNKFGNLTIVKVHPNHNNLKVFLSYSDAGVDLKGVNKKFNIQGDKVKKLKDGTVEYNGEFILISNDKKIEIDGKYSQLKVKNQ